MPRKKAPFRLDDLVDAATDVFIREGFARARMGEIARRARSATGTIYLYAASKEALFDLALRRALQDPVALDLALPVPTPSRDELLTHFQRCLHAAYQLPQLWVALDHREAPDIGSELAAILREIWQWLARYRRAILLVRSSAADWPGLSHRLERECHADMHRRMVDYLERRSGAGLLPAVASTRATASFLLATLAAGALGTGLGGDVPDHQPGALNEDAAVAVLVGGLLAPRRSPA